MTRRREMTARVCAPMLGLITLASALALPASGQTPNPQGPTFTVLQPQGFKGLASGKAVGAEGNATAEGVLYSVQDLDLMQPVAVGLFALDRQRPVKLEIVKGELTSVFRNCETGASGLCEVRFRTQGNFGIRVLPKGTAGAGYQLLVWVGEEIQAVPQNVIVPRRGQPGPGKGGLQ